MEEMRALTLWPEWAWAVARLGKNVENRTWPPPKTLEPGARIAIHAGMTFGGSEARYCGVNTVFNPVIEMARRSGWRLAVEAAENEVFGYSVRTAMDTVRSKIHKMQRGAVVAVAKFAGYLGPGQRRVPPGMEGVDLWSWWAQDQFGWILKDVVTLREPVACRGKQGLWKLEPAVMHAVLAQVEG